MIAPASVRRFVVGAAWTLAVAAGLYAADRALLGPHPLGWQEVASPDAVPAVAGVVTPPSYLPERLRWPPDRVVYRVEGGPPGWWIGLSEPPSPSPVLWIGEGAAPWPEALGEAASCLVREGTGGCAPPWHHLSRQHGERVVHVVGTLDPGELRRILAGLVTP